MNEYSFPFYCKYINGNSFFKVESLNKFIELQKIGSKVLKHEIEAVQYPEKLRIMDMLELRDNAWEKVDAEEFETLLNQVG